jgi:uncharacterized protein
MRVVLKNYIPSPGRIIIRILGEYKTYCMFRYTPVVLAICLSTLATAQKIPLINSGTLLEQGKAAYDSGNYRAAISAYRAIPERDTNYVYMLTELALAYTGNQSYDSALAICAQALQKPSRYETHLLKTQAIATDKKGDFAGSVALFEKAIARYPFEYSFTYNLGVTYYNHKDYEKAADCFFRTLAINPYHSGSHFNLGRLAIGSGHKTHAAMALGIYMGINQKDNERLVFLDKLLSNQIEDEGTFTAPFANAGERLDQILRAKIAMDKNFKTKVPLDFPVVRQMEMIFEQLSTITTGTDDRWVALYLPIYKTIKDQNLVEPYIYHILTSADNEKIKKWLQKNEKQQQAFFKTVNAEISRPHFTLTAPASFGYSKPVGAEYNDNNGLDGLGDKDAAGKRTGQWYYFHDNQELMAEGKYVAGEKKGTWKYYRDNRALKSVENYETGEVFVYFPEGGKSQHFYLKGNDIDGDVELYHPCGGTREKLTYKTGKRNGPGQSYYPSGQKELTYQYADDVPTGKFIRYYDNGTLARESEYKNGELNGLYTEYYANGKVKATGNYTAEREDGVWKYYYSNGQPEKTGAFKNSIAVGEWNFYDADGMLNETRNFSADGKWQGDNTVYFNGKLHHRLTYKNDMVVKYTAFDSQGKELASSGSDNGTFAVKYYGLNGYLSAEGSYQKGKTHGNWVYYYPEGTKRSEYTYVDGLIQGKATEYFHNGQPKFYFNYKDGRLHGYLQEFYVHGQLKKEGWYQDDLKQQQWLEYYTNGQLESNYYYINGETTDQVYDYTVTGKLMLVTRFEDEKIKSVALYNSKGEIESVKRTENNKDVHETRYASGKLKSQSYIQCGSYNGTNTRWYPDGSVFSKHTMMMGNMHDEFKRYDPANQVTLSGTYLNGYPEGQWTWYNDNGSIDSQGSDVGGNSEGMWRFNYHDGTLYSQALIKGDKRNGPSQYFAPGTDKPAMEELWEDGNLVAYRTTGTDGKPGEWQPFKADAVITAYHANGAKAIEEKYEKGQLTGARRIYYSNGNLYSEYMHKNSDKEGPYKVYYANGKLREKGEYKNNELTGVRETYQEDGSLSKSETFILGSKEGKSIWYKNGKKVSEVEFFGGSPVN